MAYWLLKSDPETYGWVELEKEKSTSWDGVRNFAARNHLKAMKVGDVALFYHSGDDKAIVGTVKIEKEFYPDPTDEAWVSVKISLHKKWKKPVRLDEIKKQASLKNMALVRIARLSVLPVTEKEFDTLLKMSD